MGLFRRKRGAEADEPVDLDARSPQTGLKYKDLLVLGQLMQAGADLTQPRHVLHFLYFTDQTAAVAASEEAGVRGFETDVREPSPPEIEEWSLVCEQHGVVLDPPTVRDQGDFFDDLAERHGGAYDGWEASV
jgi:hypothetical protein